MPRRRLNKKVALIGSTVFLLLALAAVVVILRLNRDPAPFIADGDAAWAAQDYKTARENYARAYALTQSTESRIDLLFKVADAYREMGEWDKVVGCWGQVITADPQNVKARLGRLKHSYILADSLGAAGRGDSGYWEHVLSEADKAFEVIQDAGLLDEARAQWEPSFGAVKQGGWGGGPKRLGTHLRLVKGRAAFELASMGAVTSPVEVLREAESDLQQARKLDPNNAQVYRHLAEVYLEKGDIAASRGNVGEKDAAERQADDILAEGTRAAGTTPDVFIYLLRRKLMSAQRGDIAAVREYMEGLEPQYTSLTQKFPSSPKAFGALAQFYSYHAAFLGSDGAMDKLNQAIQAAQQARALDPESVEYPTYACSYHYRKFSVYGDTSALLKSIELGEAALELPDAQDTSGPTQFARRIDRFSLCSLLAKCYVERILSLPDSDPARADLVARAEKVVHEIEQIQGSGENPQVLKWQGMLDLARGQTSKAVRSLYAAYEQIKASNPPEERDSFLAYTLATVFKDTSETGAVIEFLGTALNSGIVHTKPVALLDYGEALFQAGSHDVVLSVVDSFEERFEETNRSRVLRLKALIAKGQETEAEEAISRLNPDDPNVLELNLDLARAKGNQLRTAIRQKQADENAMLQFKPTDGDRQEGPETTEAMTAELQEQLRREADLIPRLLQARPDVVEEGYVVGLCDTLIKQGQAGAAKTVAEAYVRHFPNSVAVLFYKGLSSETDPLNCPESRRKEIREQAIGSLTDPVRQSLELGSFYEQNEQFDKAAAQWQSVLDATASQGAQETPAYLKAGQLSPRHAAAGYLFELARRQENWTLAEQIVATVRRDDLDDCGGRLFAARLAFARKEYDRALIDLDECLKQRPIFSYGYMLRGNVKAALGREHESIEDVRRAAELNPMDPVVAKTMANALHARNRRLGNNLSSEQRLETRQALEQALRLNPRDASLLSAYVDLISETEPLKALAIRQSIQISAPNLGNAILLGQLATRIALKETDETKKAAFFAVAETAFEQAKQMDPNSQIMLESYAEYFRVREQNEKARQLLVESNDQQLLWRHYFRVGGYDRARKLLEKMYAENTNRIDALKGLVLVAEETGDQQGVKKYSQELLSLEDTAVNRLAQIRAYLDVGLVSEAERKLQSFRERRPDEPRIGLMEAMVAKRQGQLDKAFELANRSLQNDPENAGAWRLRGEISFLMGQYDRAIQDFRKSRTLEDDPVATVDLAKVYLWAGRRDEAIDELRSVVDRPDAPHEARVLLEAIYRRLRRAEALKQLYADTLAEFPDSVFWLGHAGTFALEQREYDKGEELFEKACQLKQQAAAGLSAAEAIRDLQYAAVLDGYMRAMVLAAGDPTEGGSAWRPEKLDGVFREGQKYLDTPYAPLAFFRMAEAKKQLGDTEACRDYCRKAVDKAWGNDRLAVEVLLRVYGLMGGEEVTAYCRQRLQEAPDSQAANFAMFNLANIQSRYDEAITYIDKCVRLAGPDSERGVEYLVKKAELLTVAYKKSSDKGYLERAIAVYESLRGKMPKNSSVLNNLAYLLARNDQRLTEAMDYARTALEQNPDEATYLDTYAYVLYKNGRNAEAAETLAAAIQQYEVKATVPAEVYEHLGLISEALGDRSKARTAYRRALEVGGEDMPAAFKERVGAAIERLGP